MGWSMIHHINWLAGFLNHQPYFVRSVLQSCVMLEHLWSVGIVILFKWALWWKEIYHYVSFSLSLSLSLYNACTRACIHTYMMHACMHPCMCIDVCFMKQMVYMQVGWHSNPCACVVCLFIVDVSLCWNMHVFISMSLSTIPTYTNLLVNQRHSTEK